MGCRRRSTQDRTLVWGPGRARGRRCLLYRPSVAARASASGTRFHRGTRSAIAARARDGMPEAQRPYELVSRGHVRMLARLRALRWPPAASGRSSSMHGRLPVRQQVRWAGNESAPVLRALLLGALVLSVVPLTSLPAHARTGCRGRSGCRTGRFAATTPLYVTRARRLRGRLRLT